jgi:D-glycero-alpha-D-manno-heptose-7-phosphate kinase
VIIARSPLRITLGGGGTDLPSYYREHGGFLIAAAINKYVYVTITRPFSPGIYLKYSSLEQVSQIADIKHPIIREALAQQSCLARIEITTLADVPAGTGLGSSGSFTTALLKALHAHQRQAVHSWQLAEEACQIEIERLQEPIGKQDQFSAAFGGITCLTFERNNAVNVKPLLISNETMLNLEDHLLLFFTGFTREARTILTDQETRSRAQDQQMMQNLHHVKALAYDSKQALEDGNVTRFGELMHEHWEHKKRRTTGVSNPQIDRWYSVARQNGAIGGKIVGAGGGGFLLFYASDPNRLRLAMSQEGLDEVRFGFDFEGTKVVLS